jgi:hypothetical protein
MFASIKNRLSGLIHSKVVLYLLVLIALVNLYTYGIEDDQTYSGFMVIIGFLTSFFNKNMVVILFTSIIFTNILRFGMNGMNLNQFREGFDIGDLDKLTDQLSNLGGGDKTTTSPDNLPTTEEEEKVVTEIANLPNTTQKEQIAELIKRYDTTSLVTKLDSKIDFTKMTTAKGKMENALAHVDKIEDPAQRKSVKGLLDIQIKMIDQMFNISPLMDEYKGLLKGFK